jgi:hypothetical protein
MEACRASAIGALLVALVASAAPALAKGPTMDVAFGSRGVWVSQGELGPLVRVDLARGRVGARVVGAGRAVTSVAAYGFAYAADADARRIVRIDQSTDRVTASRRLPLTPLEDPSALASDGASIWLLARGGGRAHVLHLSGTMRVRRVFHLRRAPIMEVTRGRVWLAFPPVAGASRLVAIDRRSGRIRIRLSVPGALRGLARFATPGATGPEGVWVLSEDARRRGRIALHEPDRGRAVRIFRGPYAPAGIAARPEYVWATSACAPPDCDPTRASLSAYDPRSGRLQAGPFRVGCHPGGPVLPQGLAAHPGSAALAVGRYSPRTGQVLARSLQFVTARGSFRRCIPLR